jgi:5-methylcytosine-specific restriction endonuclease McrA
MYILKSRRPTIKQQPPRVGAVPSRISQRRNKETLPFYRTQKWRKFIAAIVEKRGKRCEKCKHDCQDTRIFGDHIIELRDGGEMFDETNVQLLCGSCHTTKTLRARMERMRR